MKKLIVTTAVSFVMLSSYGQKQQSRAEHIRDSLKERYLDMLAFKTPQLRQAGISMEVFTPAKITSDLYEKPFFKARYQAVRTNGFITVPLVRFKKNLLAGGFAVSHQTMEFYDVTSYDAEYPMRKMITHNTLLAPSLMYTRVDSLFNKPLYLGATATAVINPENGQYRLTMSGMVTMTLKKTARSTLSVGMIFMLNPSSPLPAIPFISYRHSFKRDLDLALGITGLSLRKGLNPRQSITVANTLEGNLSLFKYTYSTLEMKSVLLYEHLLTNKMVIGLSGGVCTTFTSKVLDGNSYKDSFIKNSQGMAPYMRVGVSFLPFYTK